MARPQASSSITYPLLVALAVSLLHASNAVADPDTLFDLVPTLAPAKTQKTIPFFRSLHVEAGTGCMLTYDRSGDRVRDVEPVLWVQCEEQGSFRFHTTF